MGLPQAIAVIYFSFKFFRDDFRTVVILCILLTKHLLTHALYFFEQLLQVHETMSYQ